MKKNKFFAILFISFIVITCICTNLYRVKAAINHEYLNDGSLSDIEYDEDEIIKSSSITDYLGGFIYTIGTLVQRITTGILSSITGSNSFPWSDRIIFNTIPILDVNFINPDPSSLLADNKIGGIIRNTYFSLLTLALGFLGIVVAVLAIRLAISTIASDKAKYKEAITKWVTAIVLLFGMHFVLSFLFYLNEQLVTVASNMLATQVKEASQEIANAINAQMQNVKRQAVQNLIDKYEDIQADEALKDFWQTVAGGVVTAVGIGLVTVATGGVGLVAAVGVTAVGAGATFGNAAALANDITECFTMSDEEALKVLKDKDNVDIIYALQSNSAVQKTVLKALDDNAFYKQNSGIVNTQEIKNSIQSAFTGDKADDAILALVPYVQLVKKTSLSDAKKNLEFLNGLSASDLPATLAEGKNSDGSKATFEITKDNIDVFKAVYNIAQKYKDGSLNKGVSANIVSSLGEYFRFNSWYIDVDGNTSTGKKGQWSATSVSIVSAILYTMLVFQSIFFFIAYIKRFFLVVVLSLMAPLVVIYDFFSKSISL